MKSKLRPKRIHTKSVLLEDFIFYISFLTAIFALSQLLGFLIVAVSLTVTFTIKALMRKEYSFFDWMLNILTFATGLAFIFFTYDTGTQTDRLAPIFLFVIAVASLFHVIYSMKHSPKSLGSRLKDTSLIAVPFFAINLLILIKLDEYAPDVTSLTVGLSIFIYTTLALFIFSLLPYRAHNRNIAMMSKYTDGMSKSVRKRVGALNVPSSAEIYNSAPENNIYGNSFVKEVRYRGSLVRVFVVRSGFDAVIVKNPEVLKLFNGRISPVKHFNFLSSIIMSISQPWRKHVSIIFVETPNNIKKSFKITIAGAEYVILSSQALKDGISDIIENI